MIFRQWLSTVLLGGLVLITMPSAYGSESAKQLGKLPELPAITPPMEAPVLDPTIQWDHRFHLQGIITGFGNNTIYVKNRPFKKARVVQYFDGVGHSVFLSSFQRGTQVGLVLGPSLEIREVWKIPDL